MTHTQLLERVEIYALGALDGEELTEFEAHLATGCDPCEQRLRETREALTLLPRSLPPVASLAAVKARLLDRIAGEAQVPASPGVMVEREFTFVRSTEGEWQEIAPGILLKLLFVDTVAERTTALVRMAAGSRYGSHRHAGVEELYMLEGTCFCGGQLLRAGDYHRAEGASIHGETYTDDGCLTILMTPQHNEMLA